MSRDVPYPETIGGSGLTLRPWDEQLVRQMAAWIPHGFPFHAFDLLSLRDPHTAAAQLEKHREAGPHRHFVALEEGIAVGRVSVNLRDSAGLYLWGVHVPPEHQGRGVCRRMLTTLMRWLEEQCPGPDFVLTTNTFAEHAHRAYYGVGFEVRERRWHFDREIAERLWKVPPDQRRPLMGHVRFHNQRWEVRTFLMARPQKVLIPSPATATPAGALLTPHS